MFPELTYLLTRVTGGYGSSRNRTKFSAKIESRRADSSPAKAGENITE